MTELGEATVKVIPDLTEFNRLMAEIPDQGVTVQETIDYTRDATGDITRTVRTVSLIKGV